MTRVLKWGLWGLGGLLGVAGLAVAYVLLALPRVADTGSQELHAATGVSELEHGRYLAEHVAICIDCHSSRDFARYSGPLKPGTLGKGGEVFGHQFGLPGELVASNITPDRETGIGAWTDAQLAQAITAGVTPDGRALFPFMNYPGYSQLCRSDLEAILGYLRNMPAISAKQARTELDFPVNLIVRTMPKAAALPEACPDASDGARRGKYLAALAGCADCHTRREQGAPIAGQELAGGAAFPLPSGYVAHSANITPDAETGIGRWSKAQFVQRFAAFRDPSALGPVAADGVNTIMPWSMYAGMTDADLGAIYDYLQSVPAVKSAPPHAVAAR